MISRLIIFFSIFFLLGSIFAGNLIANKQNPIILNAPNVNNSPVFFFFLIFNFLGS